MIKFLLFIINKQFNEYEILKNKIMEKWLIILFGIINENWMMILKLICFIDVFVYILSKIRKLYSF